MANPVTRADSVNQRASRLAFVLLFVNIMIILLGVFGMAWQSSRAAAHRSIPTNLAIRNGLPVSLPPV